jgi:hypothetical protein
LVNIVLDYGGFRSEYNVRFGNEYGEFGNEDNGGIDNQEGNDHYVLNE